MGVGSQPHAPAAFTPGKDTLPNVQDAGWAPGPVWTGAESLALTGIRFPDRPGCSQSLYWQRYPAHTLLFFVTFFYFRSGCWSDRCLSSFGCLHHIVFDVLKWQNNILPPLSGWLNILHVCLNDTDSVTLNMQLGTSSKTSEHLTSTRCRNPPEDQQLFFQKIHCVRSTKIKWPMLFKVIVAIYF
jgi:hypothetical protein